MKDFDKLWEETQNGSTSKLNKQSSKTVLQAVASNEPTESLSSSWVEERLKVSKESSPNSKAPADLSAEESSTEGEEYLADKNVQDALARSFIYESPVEMLAHYDEDIRNGHVVLHPWQIEEAEKIAQAKVDSRNPFKYVLCAANGSGKDSFVIAPLVVWFILCKIKSRVVITSSSGTQLTAQTETYIKNICYKINAYWEEMGYPKVFKINQRYIKCLYTQSEIRMYATDEPGKAEGYHPIEPNKPFLIIVNEAKSVREEIFQAIKRCTGFSHYLMISSPGEPKGSFYWAFNNWPNKRRVDAFDCTHIPLSEIEADKLELGEHSALYRSMRLALFTSQGGSIIITQDAINKCQLLCTTPTHQSWPFRIGIDLAAGGDECVISVWKGNKRHAQITWREKDTTLTAQFIDEYLGGELKISKDHAYIRADDGGVGRAVIDMLRRNGWNIQRVLNQSASSNRLMYGNRGAELWYRFKRLVEECVILLPYEDTKFIDQLSGRHYAQSSGGSNRIFLQDKKDARAHGYPSPDRADAAMLAMLDVSVETFLQGDGTENAKEERTPRSKITLEEVVREQEQQKYSKFNLSERERKLIDSQPQGGGFIPLELLLDEDPRLQSAKQIKHSNGSLDCCI